jgi:hypothetical protein
MLAGENLPFPMCCIGQHPYSMLAININKKSNVFVLETATFETSTANQSTIHGDL